MTIQVLPDPPDEQEYRSLHLQATALADDGKIDEAIVCLRQAQELLLAFRAGLGHGVDRWVRLPLYLQRAGKLHEAMLEFARLLDAAEDLALKLFVTLPEDLAKAKSHTFRAIIYRHMVTALSREARQYEKLSASEQSLSDKADKAIERYDKERSAAFEKARKAKDRSSALAAFHAKYPSTYR